jgi:hypothetical protein
MPSSYRSGSIWNYLHVDPELYDFELHIVPDLNDFELHIVPDLYGDGI